jgi:predicted nucleic acid-binding protein
MIFDASSIYRAIEIDLLEKLVEGKTIGLASYELGNVVRKEIRRKRISLDEGAKLLVFISKTISLMEVLEIGIKEEVLKIAVESDLSYYDSSYLYASHLLNDTLVTEDEKLLEAAAKKGINAFRLEEI